MIVPFFISAGYFSLLYKSGWLFFQYSVLIIDGGGGRFIRRGSIHALPSFEVAMRLAGRIPTTEHGIYQTLLFAIPTTSSIFENDFAPGVESTEKSSRRIDHPPPSRTLKEKIHEL
jgi:hypothetical protein